ncbi:MAG: sulfotransferase [Acidimicrobiia bacterium]
MNSFVCLYYPGSGSSWLLVMLGSVPSVWVPGYEPIESWHWEAEQSEKRVWLQSLIQGSPGGAGENDEAWLSRLRASPQATEPVRTGFTTVGIKMTPDAIIDHDWLVDVLDDADTDLVFLVRNNRLKHALSLYRSYEEQKNQFQFEGIMPATEIDLPVFDTWLETARGWHERSMTLRDRCMEQLGGDRVLTVAYEDFADDAGKPGVIRASCDFLGLDPSRPIEAAELAASGGEPFGPDGYYRKATSDRVSDAVSNYADLRDHYHGSDIEADFLEA